MTDDMIQDAKLQELVKQLGSAAAQRLDVDRVAQQVVTRLRAGDQPQRPSWIQPAWLKIAAALVIVSGGAIGLRQVWTDNDSGNHVAHLIADDLTDFSSDELRDVLVQFDEMVSSTALPDSTDWRELDAQQLRAVLRSLEG